MLYSFHTLTQHHPKSIVYIRFHAWCTFYEFGQIYDTCPPLQYQRVVSLPLKLSWWLSREFSDSWQRIRLQCRFDPRVRKIPWRRKWQSTPVFLPGKTHGQRSCVGYSPWGRKESVRHDLATKPQPPCSACSSFPSLYPLGKFILFFVCNNFQTTTTTTTTTTLPPSHLLFTYRTMGKQPLEMRRKNHIFFDPVTTEVTMCVFFFFS